VAVTDQQKLDFLLKKIGYTKTKTGSVVGTGAISGTPKQPFAEAIPSPLIIANGSLWNESDQIPATPPTSDTTQIKVYLAATSGLRMTADATSSGQRAYIAYSTYNNTSSARLTNWIDTQFGASYLIKVFKGDPNSGGVALSAAGSGQNDGWFFDYSAGVLNFNDTNVPSGVTDTNIYIVGYRYIGLTGAPTPTGGGNFTFNDLVVQRNLSVGGISTFSNEIKIPDNVEITLGDSDDTKIRHDSYRTIVRQHGMGPFVLDLLGNNRYFSITKSNLSEKVAEFFTNGPVDLYYANVKRFETTNTGINVTGDGVYSGDISAVDATFSGNVSIGGTLTYEDVTNVDSVGLLTARSGIRVTGGVIEAQAGENKIPSLYANMGALPSAGSYHGMFAHVHATGRGYFAHAGAWLELVNKELNGVVGTGTENYNVGVITATTFAGNGDFFDLDVDGHTELDNLKVSGIGTFGEGIFLPDNKKAEFGNAAGNANLEIYHDGSNHSYVRTASSSAGGIIIKSHNDLQLRTDNLQIKTNSLDNVLTSDINGNVSIGNSLSVAGVSTFSGNVDINADIDVDGHTNLDNVSVAGISTFSGIIDAVNTPASIRVAQDIQHKGDADTKISFPSADTITFDTAGIQRLNIASNGNISVTNDFDVDGHTNLDNVSIAGVTSVASLTSGRVVTVGTGGKLEDSANLTFDGNDLYVRGINIIGGGATSVLGADIVTRNFKATGVSTFVGAAQFDSGIKAGGSTGNNGEYLQSTGSGLTWGSFPSLRTRQTFTASSGQTTFSFAYTVGFLDVYVNGIKLTDSEFTATNGVTTVLAVGCFVGDIVELVAYNTVSAGGGAYGIGNLVEDLSPQLGGDLDLFNKSITGTGNINITGVITATKFVGDGSGLTGIVASGSGVIIKDSGSVVGTAGTIDFGNNLSVSPISAGIVTITASGGGGGGVSGINTISGVVNIADDLDVDGHAEFDNISVSGVTTSIGTFHIRPSNGALSPKISYVDSIADAMIWADNVEARFGGSSDFRIYHETPGDLNIIETHLDRQIHIREIDGTNIAKFIPGGSVELYHSGTKHFETSSAGVNIVKDLDVDGHTNLDNVSIAGVTTFTGAITVSDIRSDALTLKNAGGGASYATFSNGGKATLNWNNTKRLETDTNGVNIVGLLSATSLSGDGQGITNLPPSGHYIQDEGGGISSDAALVVNYVGAGVSATQSGSVCTVTVPAASGVSPQNLFETIAVAGQSNVVADSATDTLTFAAGSNMTITTNASNDTITFASSGGGGGGGVDVGITTNLTGSFSGGYGTASAINTYAYSSIDRVFEYTVLIERGSDFQTTKVLAKRSGTTVNATQYAVMYSNNLLAQLDVLIASGEVRLMASPEPGVSGTLAYRIKREVM